MTDCAKAAIADLDEAQRQIDRIKAERDRYRKALDAFFDVEDTHAPGKWINSPDWPPGVPVRLCADEDCLAYWPCHFEELRRAALRGDD